RQKIKSIQTTKKITHAVRLVSMSLYGKLERQETHFAAYLRTVEKAFMQLTLPVMDTWKHPVIFPEDKLDANPLIIIAATNKGLCGSLNSNLFRYISIIMNVGQHQTPSFIAVGARANKFIVEHNIGPVIGFYNDLKAETLSQVTADILEKIFTAPEPFSSVTLYGNMGKSFFAQAPYHTTLLPLDPQQATAITEKNDISDQDDVIWEQPMEEVLEQLARQYLQSRLVHFLYHTLKAEHAARFLAMENSTNNAEKCLEKLTLLFNKTRQALITREVAELCAGTSDSASL
ncbi:MAG: FoF1 ATP synthase subunit gamma, partial [Candidatus Babeliales bacterium]